MNFCNMTYTPIFTKSNCTRNKLTQASFDDKMFLHSEGQIMTTTFIFQNLQLTAFDNYQNLIHNRTGTFSHSLSKMRQ